MAQAGARPECSDPGPGTLGFLGQPAVVMRLPPQIFASSPAISLRRQLRRHRRLHRVALRLVTPRASSYEARFVEALLPAIRPGDCVWDVGANVGFYTRLFLDRVGPSGHVIALEPSPESFAALADVTHDARRFTAVPVALSDRDGEGRLDVVGELGATSHLMDQERGGVSVRTARGDTLVRAGIGPPDVVKVDVEGFEPEVIDGFGDVLRRIRELFLEVHFTALERRGRAHEPTRIVRDLQSQGFRVRWVDSSHLVATRSTARRTRGHGTE